MVTRAPAMGPPCGSSTRPVRVARNSCAASGRRLARNIATRTLKLNAFPITQSADILPDVNFPGCADTSEQRAYARAYLRNGYDGRTMFVKPTLAATATVIVAMFIASP